MKLPVRDSNTLKTIDRDRLVNYLQTHGWYEDRPFLENATIWHHQGDDEFEILLPLSKSLGDYAARIADAILTLEVVENRSQLDILNDLLTKADNVQIQGMVVEIKADESTNYITLLGIVVMMGIVVGQLQKIKVELKQPESILAAKAYEERLPVICMGDLEKKDSFFVINKLHKLAFLKTDLI